MAECLVLGLGNVLCGDDGLGVFAVQRLEQRYRAPEGVQMLDGGTLGLALLPTVQDARSVVMLDAIALKDAAPGTFVRLEGTEVPAAVRERLSPHQVGVADLLDTAALLGSSPEKIVLLGLVPDSLDLRYGLSDALESKLDAFVRRAARELAAMGYALV